MVPSKLNLFFDPFRRFKLHAKPPFPHTEPPTHPPHAFTGRSVDRRASREGLVDSGDDRCRDADDTIVQALPRLTGETLTGTWFGDGCFLRGVADEKEQMIEKKKSS